MVLPCENWWTPVRTACVHACKRTECIGFPFCNLHYSLLLSESEISCSFVHAHISNTAARTELCCRVMHLKLVISFTSVRNTAMQRYSSSSWARFLHSEVASYVRGWVRQRIISRIYCQLSYWSTMWITTDLKTIEFQSAGGIVLIMWLFCTVHRES